MIRETTQNSHKNKGNLVQSDLQTEPLGIDVAGYFWIARTLGNEEKDSKKQEGKIDLHLTKYSVGGNYYSSHPAVYPFFLPERKERAGDLV